MGGTERRARTIDWGGDGIDLIDQTLLPEECVVRHVTTVRALVDDIRRLAVRGAPALGVAGALGVALLARQLRDPDAVRTAAAELRAARPTAVNLAWGVDRALARLAEGPDAVLAEALAIRDADIAACHAMGERGADLIETLVTAPPARVMTICNTGALAAVERGTALGVVETMHERGDLEEVLFCETRPLLQGARLTAWELDRIGARHHLIVDSAAPFLLQRGMADVVLIGADRIAANGDTANKVGSLGLALAARRVGVPFLVVAPESTIDPRVPDGAGVRVEWRDPAEVLSLAGRQVAPPGTQAINVAFDVTPADLITAIVTERRVIRLDRGERPAP